MFRVFLPNYTQNTKIVSMDTIYLIVIKYIYILGSKYYNRDVREPRYIF